MLYRRLLRRRAPRAQAVRIASLEPLPPLVSNVLRVARRRPDDSALYAALGRLELAPGESLEARMMPFQREGVRFGLRAGGRLLIGDEMGLGKTVQAAALALCYRAEWPVLIVTPSSLRCGAAAEPAGSTHRCGPPRTCMHACSWAVAAPPPSWPPP